MRRSPGTEALVLVFLVLGCLEIAQTPVYDGLDASGYLPRLPLLDRLLVPGGHDHSLVVLGKLSGPIRLMARSGSIFLLLLYFLVDLIERGGPWKLGLLRLMGRRAGSLKAGIAAGLISLLVLLPGTLSIMARAVTGDHALAHDGGTIQVEEAAKMILAGRNPYVESFEGTPLANWRGFVSDAMEHVPYLPMGFLPTVVTLPVLTRVLGWYDQRLIYLVLYGLTLLLLVRATPPGDRRRMAVLGVGLNPFVVKFLLLGTNDVATLAWMVAATWALTRRRYGLAGVLLGFGGATKQFALLALPFLALHIWLETRDGSERRWGLQPVLRFLVATAVVLAITVGPFLVWAPRALVEDVVLYPAGGLESSFPIQGLHGYGVGTAPLFLRWVPDGRSDFPFWGFQLAALLLTLPVILTFQARRGDLGAAFHAYGLSLFVFIFFARYFHGNFLGFVLVFPFLAYGLAPERPEEEPCAG